MTTDTIRDVMQVCLGGHVITDVLASHPEQGTRHCERCGAETIHRCPTCGEEIPGAAPLPGLMPIGRRAAPEHCPSCGAAFPWAATPSLGGESDTWTRLERLLRRLPETIRQLRDRHQGRPTLRVNDEHDLTDLLRAVLCLQFDDMRRETRTPRYTDGMRSDFLVGPDHVAITAKVVDELATESTILTEIEEDTAYHGRRSACGGVLVLVYDPEHRLHSPERLEAIAQSRTGVLVRCIVHH
jgi:hypothetical protein